jgi:ectoine hydroxylase-related dioxygenase (phytanoyl-CoA dioxygenase family)
MPLSQQHLLQYETNGFFVVRGLFSATEVAALKAAMVSLLQPLTREQRSADTGFDPWPAAAPGDADNPHRVVYVNDLHLRHPRLNQHMRSAKIADIFCALWNADIKAFQAASVIKPPHYNADYLGWHQDMPDYIPLSNDRNGCIITYLCEMGPDSGGTSVVPATHRGELLPRVLTPVPGWPSYLKQRGMEGFDAAAADVVSPAFQPGDALVFHSSIYHRANSNITGESRIGLINVYQAEDCIDLTGRNRFKAADLPVTQNRQPISG